MSVELHPSELGFKRPFDREVTETLRLTNNGQAVLAFKVKTTAPKQYCVRPNSGLIQPNSHVEVQVLLQAMKEDPPLDYKCRDKFLVQAVELEGQHTADDSVTALWSNIEKTAKARIQEKKIRVNFLSATASNTNGITESEEPPSYSAQSPSPQFGSPAPTEKSTLAESTRSVAETTGIAGAAAAVTNAIPTSNEELQQQLAAARNQITKLTNDLKDPAFRQRKINEGQEKAQAAVQQVQSGGGVPLQITAVLCLISFLIAWLFF